MDNRPYIPWDFIQRFVNDAFVSSGVPKNDAEICTDVLLESDRRGIESHGLNRFKPIYIDRIEEGIQKPVTELEAITDALATAVIDGHNGMGQVVGYYCMRKAIEKAKMYGIGMVAARNSTHFGIAGYYVTMATDAGCIGIVGTNARPSTAPTFGVENMLGTNPITFGMPTDEPFPFVLDCATSTVQRATIEYYARMDRPTPEGLVVDQEGHSLTDSKQILKDMVAGKAALLPLGSQEGNSASYKGYGYATAVEILSAALQNGNYLRHLNGFNEKGERQPYGIGHFFIAIDPEAFLGLNSFKQTAGNILRDLRASKKAPGHDRIYTAGEKEYYTWLDRCNRGVPVSESVQKDLIAVRDMYQLPYKFPFES